MSAASIAVVDDDESLRNSLARLLRSTGFTVELFETATELLSALSQGHPACVILDLQLPGMSGVELLRRLRVLVDPPPVIVITGSDDERLRGQCTLLGSKHYFRKPLDNVALLDAVREIVDCAGTGPGVC